MNKRILFRVFLILLLGFSFCDSRALTYGGCEYSTVARLKSIVTNVNISYDYHIDNGFAYFDVTINNITPDIYFIDSNNYNNYNYSDTNNGELTIYNYTGNPGSYKFYSSLAECYGTFLGSKYYRFPEYNIYYGHELCEGIKNYSLCKKWINVNYSYNEFERLVYKYKQSLEKIEETEKNDVEYNESIINDIVNFYVNYYYYFLTTIIIVCGIIIFINRRKDKFNL